MEGPGTAVTDWTPDPRPVPAELETEFTHATFPPPKVHWSTVADQLDQATMQLLMEMARGGIGEPDADRS